MDHSLKSPTFPPVVRRARVLATPEDPGGPAEIELLEGPLAGEKVPGVFYPSLGAPPEAGEEVAANTLGLEMGLGTGGVAVIAPALDPATRAPANEDHFVKLPYTPLQFPAPAPPQAASLSRMPVVVLSLHSQLGPACCAAAALRPGCRVVFLWQEGGALPVAFSKTVRKLKDRGLLHAVVSSGSCFGGDLEAANVYSGFLAAAAATLGAEPALVLAGVGPGIMGSGASFGHGGMAAALALNAAAALGAEPVLAPRLSSADPRARHRGLSHHTRAALGAALAGCRVAFPASCEAPTGGLPARHAYEFVAASAAGLQQSFGVTFESMKRSYAQDPLLFDAAAAAATLALDGTPQ